MGYVIWRGVRLDPRTRDMMQEVAKRVPWYVQPSQGGYNRGGVAASAGTHDGGGAVDIIIRTLSPAQRTKLVTEMRRVGFAAWIRTPYQSNWPWHLHAIAVQPGGKYDQGVLSRGAAHQVVEYYEGRNGLAGRARDDATRAFVGTTWEKYKQSGGAPVRHGPAHRRPTISDRIREYGMFIAHSQHNKDIKFLVGPTSARKIDGETFHTLVANGVPYTKKSISDNAIRDISDTGSAAGGVAAPGVDRKSGNG